MKNKYSFVQHLTSAAHIAQCSSNKQSITLTPRLQQMLLRFSPYQCRVCHYYCKENISLSDHLSTRSHSANFAAWLGPLLCVRCKTRFSDNSSLLAHMFTQQHIEKVKESVRPCVIKECRNLISCPICNVIQKSATTLKAHLERHKTTGSDTNFPCGAPTKVRVCSYCHKVCRSRWEMLGHVRRYHTHQRPFTCNFCDISFIEKHSLTLHNRSNKHRKCVVEASIKTERKPDVKEINGPVHRTKKIKCHS